MPEPKSQSLRRPAQRPSSILDAFDQLAINGHREFRQQAQQAQEPEQQPSVPPSPPATPVDAVLAPLKRLKNLHSTALLIGAALAAAAALQIPVVSVAVVMLAFASGLGFLGLAARCLTGLTIAKIWCGMMFIGPSCMLLAFSFVLSVDDIQEHLANEVHRRDAIRVVMLLCGGLHVSMPLSRRTKLVPASWFTLCATVKAVVMYARLRGAVMVSALALGLLNVIGPFWASFYLMEAVGLAHKLAALRGLDKEPDRV